MLECYRGPQRPHGLSAEQPSVMQALETFQQQVGVYEQTVSFISEVVGSACFQTFYGPSVKFVPDRYCYRRSALIFPKHREILIFTCSKRSAFRFDPFKDFNFVTWFPYTVFQDWIRCYAHIKIYRLNCASRFWIRDESAKAKSGD